MVSQKKRRRGKAGEAGASAVDVCQFGFGLLAPRLGLDFANTLNSRLTAQPRELLHNYADLVSWSRQAGILSGPAAEHLARQAACRPIEAVSVYERAIALREALYRIFSAVAGERSPPAADLEILNATLSDAFAVLRIVATGHGFTWAWTGLEDTLDRALWPIALSVAELLTSSASKAVRECAAANCGWLFLDTTRNRSRRWCDMRVCGNRAKAHRHYRRTRQARADIDHESNRRGAVHPPLP